MILLDRLVRNLVIVILAAMVIVVAGNVFCRFVLQHSLYWADELAQILLVWLTFIGAALGVKDKSHYVLNFLTDRIKGGAQKYFKVMQQLISILSILILLYFSTIVAWNVRFWTMPATEISRAYVYMICPIGCLMMLYYAVQITLREFKEGRAEENNL
ncbi:TRAP-type C4-dicarboxylate transport system permease small subunit [Algoriphagus sp. 4150]|uniref:TRAP transporter small permease n=1 Tax=Algoriphagus sp. 4150 TaxID=2817756 RepID=UPI0028581EAE|nr:TRAP transporter small permease [Algoriphagus sp. 4150]MDR7131592.1 TRAP-type C4-dicarboxylate transport system permease small subunit [Algoriphagus sp. 4150]